MGNIFLIWPYFYYAIFCNAKLRKYTTIVLQQNWLYLFTIFSSGVKKEQASKLLGQDKIQLMASTTTETAAVSSNNSQCLSSTPKYIVLSATDTI